ncbi:MAG: nucleotidyltransferase family protein, partial [Oscillospiraceae bacterium]|nr:nucleotidyltransferase family protein [Oscillospiraceae bacterium]
MTDLVYENNITTKIIYLCYCAVNKMTPEPEKIAGFDLDHLYEAAQKHMLASMIGQILQKAGVTTPAFKTAISKAQRKIVILTDDLSKIVSALEAAEVWYMPLKGAVLKNYYPSFAMREMSDIDILFDATCAEEVKTIMKGLGFQVKSFGTSNDDDYLKPPVSNCEMHRALFGDKHDRKLYEYYKDVKHHLLKDEGNNYGYHFSPEDFYIFMIAHEYKHYSTGGTGLRSLLDTYVYLQKNELDMTYV